MSDFKIITDSSADLTEDMRIEFGAEKMIPFYMHILSETFIDDHTLNISLLLQKMRECTEKMASSCSDPEVWKTAFEKAKRAFAVTLSSKLSGSYASACAGLDMAKEDNPDCEGYVFDSQSAVSGETLLTIKLREFINEGLSMQEIIDKAESFISKMKTFFVLDDVSNLVKNGRMSNIKGVIVQILGIRLILGEKDGGIELFDKAKAQFNFGKMRIVEMKGLSSFYACDRGVCMSF